MGSIAEYELGTNNVVDLTDALEAYGREAHRQFCAEYQHTDKFEMSFTRGEVFVVRVLGMAKESTSGDPKANVRVIGRMRLTANNDKWTYEHGYERWVRTYDLKPIGHYFSEMNKADISMVESRQAHDFHHVRNAMEAFRKAAWQLAIAWGESDLSDDEQAILNKDYPFEVSFDDIASDIETWVDRK